MGCRHVAKDSRLDLVSKCYHGNYMPRPLGSTGQAAWCYHDNKPDGVQKGPQEGK